MKKVFLGLFVLTATVHAVEPEKIQRARVPAPPWAQGDERGMANQIGPATYHAAPGTWRSPMRASLRALAAALRDHAAFAFRGPYTLKPKATSPIPGTAHAFNSETFNEGAEPGQQGTQIDALGHFGFLRQPWDGKSPFPADSGASTTAASRRRTSSRRRTRRCSSSASRRSRRSSPARCCSTPRPSK